MRDVARAGLLLAVLAASLLAAPGAHAVNGAMVNSLPVLDEFNRIESPLSNGGKWAALGWDNSSTGYDTGRTTAGASEGWGPYDVSPTVNGAYWTSSIASEGAGVGAEVTLTASLRSDPRYMALWIDLPSPASPLRSGYQLRWSKEECNCDDATSYDVVLSRWTNGVKAVLASASSVPIPTGTSLAIVSDRGTVSAWIGAGTLSPLLVAVDSTYADGFSGIEGSGKTARIANYKAGPLSAEKPTPKSPVFTWTDPASPGGTRLPRVAGTAESGATVKLYGNATCEGKPVAEGTAAAFSSPGLAVSVGTGSTTVFHATATDAGGNVSSCSASSIAYTEASKDILFEGSHVRNFDFLMECGEAIRDVVDPLGSGRTVIDFTVHNSDNVGNEGEPGCTPTTNPRAEALTDEFIEAGDEFWLRGKFLIPIGFPSVPKWMMLAEIYGEPFGGTSPWRMAIQEDEFRFQRNATYGWDIPWGAPEVKGTWNEFMIHERFGHDGWLEFWWNGIKQKFFGPSGWYNPRKEPATENLAMETMDFSNDAAPNSLRIGQYRASNMFEVGSIYFQFIKMGTSRESVGG
jgi:hypothetical protein